MMSFQAWLFFQSFSVLVLCFTPQARAVYEQNPFLQGGKTSRNITKDLNQFNLAVILPPGKEPHLTWPGDKPPSPAAPGYVWVQVPISNTPVNEIKPSTATPLPPETQSSVAQQPSTTGVSPLVTVGPPDILYGNEFSRKCIQSKGQFPSDSCNKYVNCWEGIAIEQTCPDGLLFNPLKLYCDYAVNVNCQGKPTTSVTKPALLVDVTPSNSAETVTSSSSSSNELQKFCLKSNGIFPGSTCGKFVMCWSHNAVEQDCPEGLHFSVKGYCDYPQNVNCDKDGNTIPENLKSENTDCQIEFGNFRNKTNCSQFYTCAYYKVVANYHCPEGFSFSNLLGICDYSYRVDCSKEVQLFSKYGPKGESSFQFNAFAPEVLQPVTNFPPNAFAHPDLSIPADFGDRRCLVSEGIVRDVKNCSVYYVCKHGEVFARYVCPKGYRFSKELGRCDREDKVNCENVFRNFDVGADTLTIPSIPKVDFGDRRCLVSEGTVRDAKNCSVYYVCKQGEVVARYVCFKGYRFSKELGRCDSEDSVNCEYIFTKIDVGVDTRTVADIPEGFPFNAYAHPGLSKPGSRFPGNAYAHPELSKLVKMDKKQLLKTDP